MVVIYYKVVKRETEMIFFDDPKQILQQIQK